jgi:hypothetical protein
MEYTPKRYLVKCPPWKKTQSKPAIPRHVLDTWVPQCMEGQENKTSPDSTKAYSLSVFEENRYEKEWNCVRNATLQPPTDKLCTVPAVQWQIMREKAYLWLSLDRLHSRP